MILRLVHGVLSEQELLNYALFRNHNSENTLDTFTPFNKNLNDNKEHSLFQQHHATAHTVNNFVTALSIIFLKPNNFHPLESAHSLRLNPSDYYHEVQETRVITTIHT
jgi:guanylate kinase